MKTWHTTLPAGIKIDHLVAGGVLLLFIILFALNGHHAAVPGDPPLPGDRKGFARDCVADVLKGDAIKPSCRSFSAMQAAYDFDARNALIGEQARMSDTARRIARGEFRSRQDYESCLASGVCARVPTLTPGRPAVTPADRATLAEFWHLAQDGSMTAANCAALDLCRALVALRLIPPPPPLPANEAGAP